MIVSVQDTGIGIAKEDIPQTFSRFWRSDVSRERVSGGLGVGLSITKEIVDRHNGTISVKSELGRAPRSRCAFPRIGDATASCTPCRTSSVGADLPVTM